MATLQETNKARVRDYIENIINNHISTRFGEYVPPNGIDHSAPAGMPQGPAGTQMFFSMFFEGSSDVHNTIHEMIAEGDKVTIISTIAGTHDGNLMGLPGTGKKFSVLLLETVRMENGMYAERWGGLDIVTLMMQLGAMQTEDAKANVELYTQLVNTYIDGVNEHDPSKLRQAFAVDFVDHNNAQVTGLPPGAEGVVAAHDQLDDSFPDINFTVEDLGVEGDRVAIRVRATGTNTGSFYGFPPTDKHIEWTAHRILRVANGQFIEAWNEFDQVGILMQMGIIPSFTPPPNPEANKAIVLRLYEEENKGNVDIVDELMSPDFVIHGDALNPYQKGLEPLKLAARAVQDAFPDLVVTVEDIMAYGDKVVARLRWTGTHTKPFMGMPASGRKMSWTAIGTNRFENGKIVERWFNSDTFSLLQQFGIIPGGAPAEAAAPSAGLPVAEPPSAQVSDSQLDANKRIVQRFYNSIFNAVHVDELKEIMVDEFQDHGEALFGSPHGRETLGGGIVGFRGMFPESGVSIEEMIAEGDMVGVRGVMHLKHDAPWLGEATGKMLTWNGLSMFRIKDGKITDRYFNSDSLYILEQLGYWPLKK
ncbi:MAG: ester cyclase family protein [Chloroflexota bacterium]|nr:ester cyclase family protein [Chloroflexota bacterium]